MLAAMRTKDILGSLIALIVMAALLAGAGWLLGLGDMVRGGLSAVRLLDVAMVGLSLVWLFVLLKAPWDLYFQADAVAYEQQRSREEGIKIDAARETYVRTLRRRLLVFAIAAHVLSAALIAGATMLAGGMVGYWFAGFYLVSTAFRPAVSAYRHLYAKLRRLFNEATHPREDILALRAKIDRHDDAVRSLEHEMASARTALEGEGKTREHETRELREKMIALGREFEKTMSRMTDNQEVISGIQAFVRLIAQSSKA